MRERGSAALELALGVGFLIVPALVAVVSFGPWLEARSFVRAAAAEGARAAVLSVSDPAAAGTEAVADMAAGRGYEEYSIEMCGGGECVLERGQFVSAGVTVDIPLIATPWGDVGGVTVRGFHSEPVDTYRSLP